MVKLKEVRYINKQELAVLKAFQKRFYSAKEQPSKEDIIVFLAFNEIYSIEFRDMLQKWVKTRYKREYLTDAQISEWFEFYYN